MSPWRLRRRQEVLGQPEIHDLGVSLGGDHDVGRLEVAVDDPVPVSVLEGLADLQGNADGVLERHGLVLHPVLQGLALDILHGDEDLALVFSRFIDFADEGMVEGCGGLGLPDDALAHPRVVLELGRQEFQGDVAVKGRVLGKINLAHPAFAEEPDDLVALDLVAGAQHGLCPGFRRFRNAAVFPKPDTPFLRNDESPNAASIYHMQAS